MLPGFRFELKIISLGLVLVLLAGWFTDQLALCLLVFLLAYFTWHLRSAWLYVGWVRKNMKTIPAELRGIWKDLALILRKQRKKQKKSIKRMRQAVKRTSQLTHAIDQGIIVLQHDRKLSWWNSAASQQLGLQDSDRGHLLTSLIREPEFARYLEQKKIKGRLELPSRINPEKWLMFTASHFGDDDIVLVISDITLLKNTERLRKEFVGNVSHELRTPITVLRGYLETMSDSMIGDNPMMQKACKQMSEQVMRMQTLADDLIVLSRLESQPGKIKKKKIELLPLMESIIDEAKIVSNNKHEFSLQCPPDLIMNAQESDIHSAIGNLVINAVHHNPQGASIEIVACEENDKLIIKVKDDGVGISAEALPRLTERFYRTDSSRSSKIGGSGLGLAIVKHVVNRYEGSLEIHSKPKQGAEFVCIFPIK